MLNTFKLYSVLFGLETCFKCPNCMKFIDQKSNYQNGSCVISRLGDFLKKSFLNEETFSSTFERFHDILVEEELERVTSGEKTPSHFILTCKNELTSDFKLNLNLEIEPLKTESKVFSVKTISGIKCSTCKSFLSHSTEFFDNMLYLKKKFEKSFGISFNFYQGFKEIEPIFKNKFQEIFNEIRRKINNCKAFFVNRKKVCLSNRLIRLLRILNHNRYM